MCYIPQGECLHKQLPQYAGQVSASPTGKQHSRQLSKRASSAVPGVQAHTPLQRHPARRGDAGAAGVCQPLGSGLRGDTPCAEVCGSRQQDQGRPATSGQVCERQVRFPFQKLSNVDQVLTFELFWLRNTPRSAACER